jgi:hypothetical protein
MYRWYSTITLTMNTTKYICTGSLVVLMVSVMVLYYLYICI